MNKEELRLQFQRFSGSKKTGETPASSDRFFAKEKELDDRTAEFVGGSGSDVGYIDIDMYPAPANESGYTKIVGRVWRTVYMPGGDNLPRQIQYFASTEAGEDGPQMLLGGHLGARDAYSTAPFSDTLERTYPDILQAEFETALGELERIAAEIPEAVTVSQ